MYLGLFSPSIAEDFIRMASEPYFNLLSKGGVYHGTVID
jgi:hypothetical protein